MVQGSVALGHPIPPRPVYAPRKPLSEPSGGMRARTVLKREGERAGVRAGVRSYWTEAGDIFF